MTAKPLRFALFGNVYQHEKSSAANLLLQLLLKQGATVAIEKEYLHFLQANRLADTSGAFPLDADRLDADFAVSMGGDGTLLHTADKVGSRQIPILGINMGRLGFLASISPDELPQCVEALFSGDYEVERRATIEVSTDGMPFKGNPYALNDVAVLKRDTAAMISIRATVDGDYLTTYQADGIIVSTPTGSTAYSLSNGGPVIVPGTRVMLITPVAPHSLNVRPIVLPDSAVVELTVNSRSHNFLVAIDGRSEMQAEPTTLRLRRAGHDVLLVKRSGRSYFTTLREKLMWGSDLR